MDPQKILDKLIANFEKRGAPTGDSVEFRSRRAVMAVITVTTMIAGFLWGALYFVYKEPVAGAIPAGYSILTLINGRLFLVHKKESYFNFIQLGMLLLLPFLLMYALGGFVNSSAVILWSFVTPLATLVVFGRQSALRWFLAYIILGLISGLLEPFAPASNNLPQYLVIGFFVLNISAPAFSAFLLLYAFVGERNKAYQLLGIEQQKSDRLLLNVLPQVIADRLKNDDARIAEYFDEVTVLFADVVGFTPMSEVLSAAEAVDLLNEVFSHFDALARKYEVEKIRTIGDGYMVAAGAPVPKAGHAQAICRMALEMIAYMEELQKRGNQLQIRIGINSGHAVGGIIGTTKFHYDLWGDMVNTAARMESHGVPGKIQIAGGTYERVRDEFPCLSRGKILIKGKGEIETWFLGSQGF